jgi:hypothetical protein
MMFSIINLIARSCVLLNKKKSNPEERFFDACKEPQVTWKIVIPVLVEIVGTGYARE